jgi:hypothetical protein
MAYFVSRTCWKRWFVWTIIFFSRMVCLLVCVCISWRGLLERWTWELARCQPSVTFGKHGRLGGELTAPGDAYGAPKATHKPSHAGAPTPGDARGPPQATKPVRPTTCDPPQGDPLDPTSPSTAPLALIAFGRVIYADTEAMPTHPNTFEFLSLVVNILGRD